jgi:uncharacterized RDD family membrane protein YckC
MNESPPVKAEVEVEKELGVYYAAEDYAGILRRLFILVVDGLVMLTLVVATFLIMGESIGQDADSALKASGLLFLLWYVYMAVLKITPLGTLGYRLAGVRLVTIYGERPSIWRSSFRFAFIFAGPLNPICDVIWLGGETDRQGMRDKFAGTYVVRRGATPAGRGRVGYEHLFLGAWALVFRRVKRGSGEGPGLSAAADEASWDS